MARAPILPPPRSAPPGRPGDVTWGARAAAAGGSGCEREFGTGGTVAPVKPPLARPSPAQGLVVVEVARASAPALVRAVSTEGGPLAALVWRVQGARDAAGA